MNVDGEDAPMSLYLEQWPAEPVADRQLLEIIFVEEGYDLPLRDIESVLVLQDCLKPTPLPGPGAKRLSDAAAPDVSPAKRQRTESEAEPPSALALDADVMRAVLGQSPVSTVVSNADGTPQAVTKTPETTAPPQQEPSFSLTTPQMSFDEPALRNPTQADTPEREFVEDQQEYWEETPQHPLADRPDGTTGIQKEEETTDIDEQEGTTDIEEEAEESELDSKRKAQCALVVTPKAVIEQWKEQLTKTFMRRNALRVCMFYEDKRDKISDDMLATYDLVLTTFKTLQVDVLGYRRNGELIQPKGRLSQFHWSRVILDEAHQTKTEKVHPRSHVAQNLEQQRLTKLKACCAVEADIRWCVTGTPMDGRVEHLDALFKFLKAPSTLPKEELMLMRTKKGVVNVEKIWHHEDIELEAVERRFYNQMTDFIETWQCETARNRIWMSDNRASIGAEVARLHRKPDSECTRQSNEPKHVAYWEKYDELCKNHPMWDAQSPQWEYLIQAFPMYRTLNGFTTDLRLRQISVHMAIAEKAVGTGDAVDDAAQALDEEVRKSLLANGVSREELKRIFQADHVSSKMKRLLQLLVPTVKGGEKCVVVSQWESLLQIVGRHLDKTGISHEIMSGKISAKERYASAQRFNNRDSKPQVLLLASQSCGTGVDLPGGTHMFLMEPQKSAALEKQVFNRLHRIGQTKNVHYYRLVAVDTVEQRVMRQRMDREYETKKYFTN